MFRAETMASLRNIKGQRKVWIGAAGFSGPVKVECVKCFMHALWWAGPRHLHVGAVQNLL